MLRKQTNLNFRSSLDLSYSVGTNECSLKSLCVVETKTKTSNTYQLENIWNRQLLFFLLLFLIQKIKGCLLFWTIPPYCYSTLSSKYFSYLQHWYSYSLLSQKHSGYNCFLSTLLFSLLHVLSFSSFPAFIVLRYILVFLCSQILSLMRLSSKFRERQHLQFYIMYTNWGRRNETKRFWYVNWEFACDAVKGILWKIGITVQKSTNLDKLGK